MLLLVSEVSRGTNGAIHCNQPLSVHKFPVVFITACLLLQKACSEKACSEKVCSEKVCKRRALLSVLMEEFCTSPNVHTAVEICHMP